MRFEIPLVLSILMMLVPVLFAQNSKAPWVSDQGDGTFKNPVLFADYSDPDVIRVGEDFYMTASSFNCSPGLPILHSKDLVNWTIIGHAIQRLDDRFNNTVLPGYGLWAPSIRYHDGFYWIFVGDPDVGILMTKARNPAGPWEPMHVVQAGRGLIDTCPLWDDDGQAYLVHAYANSRSGRRDILVANKMSPDGTKLIGDEVLVIDGRNGLHPTLEGPKFYKRNGWYYILAPAGGVRPGWQMAFRSRSPLGPYEAKKVLEQGSTNISGPHQGGWVELESGEGWFMHFQDRGGYGRIVHLNPVRWVDDWPLMGEDYDKNGVGEPVSTYKKPNVGKTSPIQVPQMSDEFDSTKLGLQWQWQANQDPAWYSTTARPGWMRLNGMPRRAGTLSLTPNLLLQKFPAPSFKATTKLEFNPGAADAQAGIIVMAATSSALLVSQGQDGLQIKRVTDQAGGRRGTTGPATEPVADQVEGTVTGLKGPIWLRVTAEPEAICTFSYSTDGEKFTTLGTPLAARQPQWMGAKVGIVCLGQGAHADFDWFRIEP
jgi:beta-xylosidase